MIAVPCYFGHVSTDSVVVPNIYGDVPNFFALNNPLLVTFASI
ncbi:Nitrite-sensitive transcriptional repressor NsrR [Chitinispirillum alkaliphilum]|nr:Nitrite-sensitive transcriptional repressor NsrR [Chitinispirillum alkaliphilum]